MKKLRTLLVKNFHYLCIVSVIAFGLITIIGSGGGGGSSDPVPTPSCNVPCLATNLGNTSLEFEEQPDQTPLVVVSDGAVAGINDVGQLAGVGGEVTDCNNGVILIAGIDLNGNLDIEDPVEFFDASGNLKISDCTLTITNLVIDGVSKNDIVATYVGTLAASVHIASEIPPEIPFDIMDKLREDW